MTDESPEQISNEIQEKLQRAILENYPNPERRGCSGETVVRNLAKRRLPTGDPAWEHITHCSPCYREYLDFRREFASTKRRLVRRNRLTLASAFALVVIIGIVIWVGRPGPSPAPPAIAYATVQVDMRPFSQSRSDAPEQAPDKRVAATFNRQPTRLNIVLPVGLEEGSYEVRLIDNELRPVTAGTGVAAFADHVATLSISFDFSKVAPGNYVLALRAPGGNWVTSPVSIR